MLTKRTSTPSCEPRAKATSTSMPCRPSAWVVGQQYGALEVLTPTVRTPCVSVAVEESCEVFLTESSASCAEG